MPCQQLNRGRSPAQALQPRVAGRLHTRGQRARRKHGRADPRAGRGFEALKGAIPGA